MHTTVGIHEGIGKLAKTTLDNAEIAEIFDRTAGLLATQEKNAYRVRSYRQAANILRDLDKPASEILKKKGKAALRSMEGIGEALSGAIEEIVETGRFGMLDRLLSETRPEDLLSRVPGIGPKTAARLHEQLNIETLEELELAAHDGRLEDIRGIGERTTRGVRDALAGMLGRSSRRRARQRIESPKSPTGEQLPKIGTILELDAEYRRRAEADKLRTIAPRRFNPEHVAWLPIMKVRRDSWDFTLLFSNTKRAHDLDKTADWVVIYFRKNGTESQCTVVTATRGRLEGKRVVRGREQECREHYG